MKKVSEIEVLENIKELNIKNSFNIEDVNTVLDVITIGNEKLRKINKDINNIDEIKPLIVNMVNTLIDENGCGLAAPQIGENVNLFIAKVSSLDEDDQEIVELPLTAYINPEIVEYSDETDFDFEGCLSVPGYDAEVERSSKVKIKYTDIFGNIKVSTYEGFLARVIQHEYDHLNGIIYTDKADMRTFTTRENLIIDRQNEEQD